MTKEDFIKKWGTNAPYVDADKIFPSYPYTAQCRRDLDELIQSELSSFKRELLEKMPTDEAIEDIVNKIAYTETAERRLHDFMNKVRLLEDWFRSRMLELLK